MSNYNFNGYTSDTEIMDSVLSQLNQDTISLASTDNNIAYIQSTNPGVKGVQYFWCRNISTASAVQI